MSGLTYFGSQAAAELERWQNSRRKIHFDEKLSDGGSGALLAFVHHEGDADHPQHRLLLKLCADDEGAVTEPGDLEEAWHSGPDYSFDRGARPFLFPDRRLIRQVYPPLRVGGTWLMFLDVALDERGRYPLSPLSAVPSGSGKAQVAAAVIDSILTEWNPDRRADHDMSAQTFLEKALGHRAVAGSPLARASARLLGADLHNTSITLPGWPSALPNPTPFADRLPLAGLKPPTVALGRAHYDLHPGNIMVATQPGLVPDSFRLVDLSRFQEKGLLLRDPVHLMLCLVCDHLPNLDEPARSELVDLLLDQDGDTTDSRESLLPGSLLAALQLLRCAPDPWRAARRYAHPDWHPQYLLALQACALMFLTRRTERDEQLWFLRLAASACAAFQPIAKPHAEHPSAPAPATPDRSTTPPGPPDEATGELPSAVHIELTRHQQQLQHLCRRCAEPRFDSALTDNLRVIVNRCAGLAALVDGGPRTGAAAVFHRQCTLVLHAAEALQAAQSDEQTPSTTARSNLVTALTRLLEFPGRDTAPTELERQSSSRGPAEQSQPTALASTHPDTSNPPGFGKHVPITVKDTKEESTLYAVQDIDDPSSTSGQLSLAQVLRLPVPPPASATATELAALLRDIDRLPADASGPRLAYLARRLCKRAARLANSLTDLDTTLLRNQLVESGELTSQFDSTTPPAETLRLLRQAGQQIRSFGHELWPDEIG